MVRCKVSFQVEIIKPVALLLFLGGREVRILKLIKGETGTQQDDVVKTCYPFEECPKCNCLEERPSENTCEECWKKIFGNKPKPVGGVEVKLDRHIHSVAIPLNSFEISSRELPR